MKPARSLVDRSLIGMPTGVLERGAGAHESADQLVAVAKPTLGVVDGSLIGRRWHSTSVVIYAVVRVHLSLIGG